MPVGSVTLLLRSESTMYIAISVEITLNRFLDYHPVGRMYVLKEELKRVRMEEAQNRAARPGPGGACRIFGAAGGWDPATDSAG